jgi:hypothetical protein
MHATGREQYSSLGNDAWEAGRALNARFPLKGHIQFGLNVSDTHICVDTYPVFTILHGYISGASIPEPYPGYVIRTSC